MHVMHCCVRACMSACAQCLDACSDFKARDAYAPSQTAMIDAHQLHMLGSSPNLTEVAGLVKPVFRVVIAALGTLAAMLHPKDLHF